ncbi:MAG: hypothetical protein P4L50_03670 [Anaerolineaceae bacterium]|nr:hypothetical protein [Anaerolineaceae bacterium]
MAETFDCSSCGAPINFDPAQLLDQKTMSCPYCGESIIIPKNLRRSSPPPSKPPEPNPSFNTDREEMYHPLPTNPVVIKRNGLSPRFWWGFAIFIAAIVICSTVLPFLGLGSLFFINGITKSPTPLIDKTSTAQAASNLVFQQQNNWPVLLQEKFVNNQLNWNTGTTNDSYSLSDQIIAGGKYTWQITSKKSMLTYTNPHMAAQTDLLISTDLLMTTANQNRQDEAGIIFRYSDTVNTFYFFGVNPVGSYLLTRFNGTNFDDLIRNDRTGLLKPYQVNHIAVSMQGDQILLIINNVVVDSYQDSQLSSGYAGLAANLAGAGENATIIFTNFNVRTPKQ